jgi:hypothetical protein
MSNNDYNAAVANQIAGMSFLLTFLSAIGAVGGIGFTIFGYYQTNKLPQLIEEEVIKRTTELNQQIQTQKKELLSIWQTTYDNLDKGIKELIESNKRLNDRFNVERERNGIDLQLIQVKLNMEKVEELKKDIIANYEKQGLKADEIKKNQLYKEVQSILDSYLSTAKNLENRLDKIDPLRKHIKEL